MMLKRIIIDWRFWSLETEKNVGQIRLLVLFWLSQTTIFLINLPSLLVGLIWNYKVITDFYIVLLMIQIVRLYVEMDFDNLNNQTMV